MGSSVIHKASSSLAQTIAQLTLQRVLALAGWTIDFIDLDMTTPTAKVDIRMHRADGRWLWARVDSAGRCSIEMFQRERHLSRPVGAGKGRFPLTHQIDDVFLGRIKPEGPRAMLRCVTSYVVDNAHGDATLADMRAAWAAVMTTPTKLLEPLA